MGRPDQEWAGVVAASGRRAWTLVIKSDGRALAKYRPVCQCGGYKPDWAKTVRIRDVMLPVDNPVFQKGKSRCSRRLQTPYPPTHWRKGKEVANDVLCFSNPLYVYNKFDGVSQHLGNLDQGGAVHGGCMTLDWGGFFYDQVMKPSPPTKSICGRHMPRDADAIPVRILPLLEYPLNWRPYIEGALSECRCAARKHRRTQSCAVAARSCRRGGLEGALGETGEDVWHETQEWQEWMGREWLGVMSTVDGAFNVMVDHVVDGGLWDRMRGEPASVNGPAFHGSRRTSRARRRSGSVAGLLEKKVPLYGPSACEVAAE